MRLFKRGLIEMPLGLNFQDESEIPESFYMPFRKLIRYGDIFSLTDIEKVELQEFINKIDDDAKDPFEFKFLKLAFEAFNLSFSIQYINMAYLSLIIALETLFNPSHELGLRSRIARNIAVLLGENKEKAIAIEKEIKKIYDLRSEIVHTGKLNIIDVSILLKARDYVRRSIREIYKMNKNKNILLKLLNMCGFGERPWK